MKTEDYLRAMAKQAEIISQEDPNWDEFPDYECYYTEAATLEDLDDICATDELAQEGSARRAQIEKAIRQEQCWLMADNENVVAYGIFDHSFKNQGLIHTIHVHPEYRRQGVARDLLEKLSIECESKWLYALVPLHNLVAEQFMASQGFRLLKNEAHRRVIDQLHAVYRRERWAEPPGPVPDFTQVQ